MDWVGVGLSEAGGMHGADIALLRRVPTSKMGWVLEDRFSTEFAQPLLDAEQDKTLESVEVMLDVESRGLTPPRRDHCSPAVHP